MFFTTITAELRRVNLTPALCFILCLASLSLVDSARAAQETQVCKAQVAQWIDPNDGDVIDADSLFDSLVGKSVILLGEVHDNAEHHRWQHQVLAALHSRRQNMIVGL